jgi:tetratricopeptide (TPR) repeat protein
VLCLACSPREGASLERAAATPAATEPTAELEPIPEPASALLEEGVAAELANARRELHEALDGGVVGPELASHYGRLGVLHHAHGLWAPAEACYRNAVLLDRDQIRWAYFLGVVLQLQGRSDEAASVLTGVVERFPGEPNPILRLAELELGRGHAEAARALFDRGLVLDPQNAAAHVGLGRAMLDAGDPRGALAHLLLGLEIQPAATRIHHVVARCYRALGDLDAVPPHLALAGDREVTSRDPLLEEVQSVAVGTASDLRRGDAATLAGDHAAAAKAYARAVELSPRDASARHSLAASLVRSGRLEEGRREYEEALRLDPANVDVLISLAALDLRAGNADAAVVRLRRAVESAPGLVEARVRLGASLVASGAAAEGLEQLETALRSDPGNADAASEKASALLALGRGEQAIEILEPLVAANPGSPSVERRLADALAAEARYSEAVTRYTALLTRNPRDADARLRLATASTLDGRYTLAVEVLEEGLKLGSGHYQIQHALATLLATCPDDRVRDGGRALALAREALADQATVERAETVGLALAAMGDFERAAQWQRRILAQLGPDASSSLAARLRANLERYARGERGLAPWEGPESG